MPKGDRTFETNINTLFDELYYAKQWGRPSILIVAANDHWTRNRAMAALEKKLRKSAGLSVARINLTDIATSLVPSLKTLDRSGSIVYFAHNLLQFEGHDRALVYKALNMQRELFVEGSLKLVFWLRMNEASLLPVHAPDFWAFRHRVIEFFDAKKIPHSEVGTSLLCWHNGELRDPPSEMKRRIDENLQRISEAGALTDSKIRICCELAGQYWQMGEVSSAYRYAREGLEHTRANPIGREHHNLLNALAIIFFSQKKYADSADILIKLAKQTDDPIIHMNLAIALVCTARRRQGLLLAVRTANMHTANPVFRSRLGYLYFLTGRLDQAIESFGAAFDQDTNESHLVASAICQHHLGHHRRAADGLHGLVIETHIGRACREILNGEDGAAMNTLSTFVWDRGIGWELLLRNPNLWMAVHPRDFNEVVKGWRP